MEPILEAKKLNLWYGPNHALHDVSIAIPEHEITAFIGPSGCGKSTILRLVAGLITPTLGRVTVNGEEISGPSPSRGLVFQNPTLFPWLTAEKNISFSLDLRGEVVEMDIDRGVAVGMAHIDGLAKPMRAHGDLADETVGHGVERLARHAVGLDVDAGMEMVRSRLAEVARQLDGVVDGRDISDRGQQKTCEHRLTRWP